jgi:hypothetical protein
MVLPVWRANLVVPLLEAAMTIWTELLGTRSAEDTRDIAAHASRFRRSGPPSRMLGSLSGEERKS